MNEVNADEQLALAVKIQTDLHLWHTHVVWVDIETGSFAIAHTDGERAVQWQFSLELCRVHQWLLDGAGLCEDAGCPGCFPVTGWYEVWQPHLDVKGIAL